MELKDKYFSEEETKYTNTELEYQYFATEPAEVELTVEPDNSDE